ncbi:MAG: hypothetical protein M1819_003276 [Sarea resinae]|nr:MAG: hypothetical protein M1819_003276 [Sarea resinae]
MTKKEPQFERKMAMDSKIPAHVVEERSRARSHEDDDDETMGNASQDDGSSGPSKKKRRSRKDLDKKFECPHEGCGKSYSRAEHLYRHQLNHTPKQIFHCDFPDCPRSFVRQDLCARHKERHTARGSQLQRKDAFAHSYSPLSSSIKSEKLGPSRPPNDAFSDGRNHPSGNMHVSPADSKANVFAPTSAPMQRPMNSSSGPMALDQNVQQTRSDASLNRSLSDGNYRSDNVGGGYNARPGGIPIATYDSHSRHASFGTMDAQRPQISPPTSNPGFARPPVQSPLGTANMDGLSLSSPYNTTSAPSQGFNTIPMSTGNPSRPYMAQQNFPPLTSLPPPTFSTISQTTPSRSSEGTYTTSPPTSSTSIDQTSGEGSIPATVGTDPGLLDQMTASYSIPVFGGEGYSRSPFAMADDFAAWLFAEPTHFSQPSPMGRGQTGWPALPEGMMGQVPYFPSDVSLGGQFPPSIPQQHPMAVTSILDTSLPESILSEEKRQELLDLIIMRFNETDHAPVKKQKEVLLEGDRDQDNHVLSLHMMQTYIGSFWYHFHPQLPILHKPTFVADKTQNLLLIAMMAIGASCLDKMHGHGVTTASSELSSFLAWHLRWETFSDADFRPPAKLWVFQALLLLELYEKMYSTRALHERAHIHHATTITLMRRGSSLIGRSALDSPPSVRDDKGHGLNGSSHTSGSSTPDEWWNHWITNEATRRAAFVAFVIDSTHATMFGHSAVMVAHEMRLPLPCDEALWSATSSAEVGRVEASLHANGVKPTTFLDGLKKTLNGQTVRTNSFGRTILMAGLLSVSWHMNQRDLQVSSLGVSQALGGRDRWRGSLTRAFDFWKQDFDQALTSNDGFQEPYRQRYAGSDLDDDNIYESRTVLHHLAHMAMHVDIVDCQIFAGAGRLLGRTITPQDYSSAQRRMKESWAPTARARDATFYALSFLRQVLLSETRLGMQGSLQPTDELEYSARDDFLLNRPWVLYFATLVVWSYGYALDGPLSQSVPSHQQQHQQHSYAHRSHFSTREAKIADTRAFLTRVGGVRSPDDLASVGGRNECVGLLMILRDSFQKTRWELLHEAAILLTNCLDMLFGERA